MKTSFILDPRLERDTQLITTLTLSQVRLMNNANYPWIVLVPQVPDISELYQLSLPEQAQLLQEINQISHLLKKAVPCDKLNIGLLGNEVKQLHAHVLARTVGDVHWPKPVWGHPGTPYSASALAARLNEFKAALS